MRKKFKSKKKHKINILKLLLIFSIIYISFNLIYNLIYNLYLKDLSNEKIINHIIQNTKKKEKSSSILTKYQNPDKILKDNFIIKETNSSTINVDKNINTDIQVYIYNTHETESYEDKYLEIYNIKPTVKTMSYILKDYLTDLGINTYVEEQSVTQVLKSHNWSYRYSYDASKEIIAPFIKDNSSLKLIIDLHRDSAPLSKTFITIDNINYAKILFVIGEEHENYKKNYQLSKKLNDLLDEEISGITRGISEKSGTGVNGIYNQNLSPNSVLIELGGQYNEIEELNNTLKILSRVILKYIEGEIWKTAEKHGLYLDV